jgi:serine/threonine-protein kinase
MSDSTPDDVSLSPTELDQVIAVCDQFEAAWKAGAPRRMEDVLPGVPETLCPAIFRQLLALELELRRKRGDRPDPAEYRGRFPDRAADIAAAFTEPVPAHQPTPTRPRPDADPHANAAHNLLFGLLAFQNGFIDRDALLAAFNAWVADRARPIGRVLLDLGSLDPTRHALLEALVAEHLKRHGGNPEKSLADLSSVDAVTADLRRLPGEDVQASIAAVGRDRTGPHSTATGPGGRRPGERFRILKLHAEGGLGRVYEAHDAELGRTVALKEIRPDRADDNEYRSRFVLEAEISGALQHPGIVPIYSLGTYADGKPYYAMRFVEGASLKDAIAQHHRDHPRPDPNTVEFRMLLQRFVDVCNAIAFAHSRGVLHRDLKPHNVMIGAYGEALIIDWGLAKATGRTDPAGGGGDAPLVPPSGSGASPTVGAIGSPAYMSPEQARGEVAALGPATDVYGLGAVLYQLLTGRAPIVGQDQAEVRERVLRGEIEPPRSLNPNIPRLLEAVCLKALALDPRDRYPTARALREDVEHWLADEPVIARRDSIWSRGLRWARRHQTLTATASAVVLVLTIALGIGLRRERINAAIIARESAEAERRLDQAFQTNDAYFENFNDEGIRTGRLPRDLVASLITRPREFYEQITRELAGKPRATEKERLLLARAHVGLGRMHQILGADPESRRELEAALPIWDELIALHPDDPNFLMGRAQNLNSLAASLYATGDRREAAAALEQARSIQAKLAADHPDVPLYQHELARSHVNRGASLAASRDPAAVEEFRKAVAIEERLVAQHPEITDYQHILAGSLSNLAVLLDAIDPRSAEATHRRAIAVGERLVADRPGDPTYRNDLARAYLNLGVLLHATSGPAAARGEFERAVAMAEKVVADHPYIGRYRNLLAAAYANLGDVLSIARDPGAARVHEKAVAVAERLVTDSPGNLEYQIGLAVALHNLGSSRVQESRHEEAIPILRRAWEHQKAAQARMPSSPEVRQYLRQHGLALAESYRALRRPIEAAAATRELIPLSSDNPGELYEVAQALALCVPIAPGPSVADRYAGEAVAVLEQAVRAGWSDAMRPSRDPAFNPLRERGDFRRLLTVLLDRGFPADAFAP